MCDRDGYCDVSRDVGRGGPPANSLICCPIHIFAGRVARICATVSY